MRKWHLTADDGGHYLGLNPAAANHCGFDYASPVLSRSEFAVAGDRDVAALTDKAIRFIERRRDRPWFCFLSHPMIHGVVVAPEEIERKYRDRGYGDQAPNRAAHSAQRARDRPGCPRPRDLEASSDVCERGNAPVTCWLVHVGRHVEP